MQTSRREREKGIADRLHFGGFQKDVRPFLNAFDLFAHPSYAEPFGLSIAEAMAMQSWFIACATGGVPEIITHGVDGMLVEERSAEAVAREITVLMSSAELRKQMGERARRTIRRRFSPLQQSCEAAMHYQKSCGDIERQGATKYFEFIGNEWRSTMLNSSMFAPGKCEYRPAHRG